MLKFLRKYDKIILAIGGTLLMIAFLVPQALQQYGGDPRSRTVATLDGRKVTEGALMEARQELAALKQMEQMLGDGAITEQVLRIEGPEHWFLLTREAEEAGLVGGVQDGVNFLRTAAEIVVGRQLPMLQQMGQSLTPELFTNLVNEVIGMLDARRLAQVGTGGTEEGINRALAKAHGVVRMYDMYVGAGQLSDVESISLARRYYDEARIDFAKLPASRLAFQSEDPTDEQILAHFERFKNVRRGEGEYGFGYLRDPAVSLDWMKIDREAIAAGVRIDRVEAYTHWQQNRGQYAGEYEQAKTRVEEDLKSQAVESAVMEAVSLVQRQILNGERGLMDDGRFKALPEDWEAKRPAFNAIAESVNARLLEREGVAQAPVSARQTPLMTRLAVEQAAGLGESWMAIGPRQIPTADLVFSTRELEPTSPFAIQAGLTVRGSLRDAAGNVYFVRVNRARAASPPESPALVRGEIEQDLKTLAAYERLVANAEQIREAAALNFDEASIDNGAVPVTGLTVRRTGMQTAQNMPATEDINTDAVRNAIMDRMERLDPTIAPNRLPALDRIVAVPMPESLALGLAIINSVEPISIEQFRGLDQTMIRQAQGERANDILAWAFSSANMMERHGFRFVRGEEPESEEETTEAPAEGEPRAAR